MPHISDSNGKNHIEDTYLKVTGINPKSSLVYTPTIHKKRRRALRALFSDKSLQVRGLSLVNKSKKASTCRREAAALTVQCLPRAPWRQRFQPT